METKKLTALEIFGEDCLVELSQVTHRQAINYSPIVQKHIEAINQRTNQENDITYLSYLAEYLFNLKEHEL